MPSRKFLSKVFGDMPSPGGMPTGPEAITPSVSMKSGKKAETVLKTPQKARVFVIITEIVRIMYMWARSRRPELQDEELRRFIYAFHPRLTKALEGKIDTLNHAACRNIPTDHLQRRILDMVARAYEKKYLDPNRARKLLLRMDAFDECIGRFTDSLKVMDPARYSLDMSSHATEPPLKEAAPPKEAETDLRDFFRELGVSLDSKDKSLFDVHAWLLKWQEGMPRFNEDDIIQPPRGYVAPPVEFRATHFDRMRGSFFTCDVKSVMKTRKEDAKAEEPEAPEAPEAPATAPGRPKEPELPAKGETSALRKVRHKKGQSRRRGWGAVRAMQRNKLTRPPRVGGGGGGGSGDGAGMK